MARFADCLAGKKQKAISGGIYLICEHFMEQPKDYLRERECVGAFVVRNSKILLGKRRAELDFYPGVWDAFGGHRQPNESLEETIRRELREELGITPTAFEYLRRAEEPHEAENGAGLYHFYLVTAFDGEPRNLQPEEHAAIGWFDFEEIARLPLAHPLYNEMINEIADQSEILEIVRAFENGTISRSRWRHADHLTVALYYVYHHDFETAYDKMRGGLFNLLRAFEVDLSKEMPYHETQTIFWLRTVADYACSRAGVSLVAVRRELVEKFDKDYPLEFYSRERLFSDKARAAFVEADL